MRRLRIVLLVVVCCLVPRVLTAQGVGELWKVLPDELVPYLSEEERSEMIERSELMLDGAVTNELQDISYIDTLSTSYGRFVLSSARTMEIILLPSAGDTLICLIDTYEVGGKRSVVSFYDIGWSPVEMVFPMPAFEVTPEMFTGEESDEQTVEDESLGEAFSLCSVSFDPSAEEFVVNFSLPFLSVEEKEKIDLSKCKRRLKWTGNEFLTVINS